MKKKFFTATLCGMMVLSLAACGNNGGSNADAASNVSGSSSAAASKDADALRIGVCLPSHVQFFTTAEAGIKEYADSHSDVDITIFDANSDVSTQISQVQTCVTDGYDAIVTALVQNDSAAEVKSAAGDKPVAFFNILPSDKTVLDETHVYVGMKERDAGVAQGEFLADALQSLGRKDINAVMMLGPIGLDPTNERTAGVKETLKDKGYNVTYVFEDTADWDKTKAMDKFAQFMGKGESYDCVIANADDLALGVIEAMNTANVDPSSVPIVGVDATETGCDAIKNGTMAMTVNQNPKNQGAMALDYAVKLARGEEVETNDSYCYFTDPEVVTKDNVDEVLKEYRD